MKEILEKKILAIDPSLKCTGYYYSYCDREGYGIISAGSKADRHTCLWTVKMEIAHINSIMNGVDILLIEDYAYSKFGGSNAVTALAEVAGIIKAEVLAYGGKVFEIPSKTWKSIVGWKTLKKVKKAEKEFYIRATETIFKRRFETPDECDAFMIFLSFSHICQGIGVRTQGYLNLYKQIQEVFYGKENKEKIYTKRAKKSKRKG